MQAESGPGADGGDAREKFGDEVAVRSARGTYEVSGFVDAENGFGAMLRMTWTCDARPTTTGYRGTATVVE